MIVRVGQTNRKVVLLNLYINIYPKKIMKNVLTSVEAVEIA
jgi:hypothetical protein